MHYRSPLVTPKAALAVLLGLTLLRPSSGRGQEAEPAPTPLPVRSTVFLAHDEAAVTESYVADPGRIRAMVARLIPAAAGTGGEGGAPRAWRELGVEAKDVVGIKVAAAGGAAAPARRAVVAGIVESLIAAGHAREKILVWDRDEEDLRAAGFLGPTWNLCPVTFTAPRDGWDAQAVYTAPTLGKLIWGDLLFRGLSPRALTASRTAEDTSPTADGHKRPDTGPGGPAENLSNVSHWTTVLTRRVTKVVNVPTLSDDVHTGIGGALHNVTLPNLDNWRRFAGQPRWGNPTVAELWGEPALRGKVVLNVCDGLVGQFAGGPVFQPLYAHRQATVYASRDPVALDAVALRLIELWRAQRGLPALDRETAHIHTAALLGLGHDAPERIDLRTVTP